MSSSAAMVITDRDRWRIAGAAEAARSSWRTYAPYLDGLLEQLNRAHVVPSADIPHDIVTLHSRVEITDFRSGRSEVITLVYPGEEDPKRGNVSVFDPAGLALLGARVGDLISWNDPKGMRIAKVSRIHYQPEAAGDYDR